MAKKTKHPLHLPDDSDEMKEAIAALEALAPSGVKFVRKTAHQLKSRNYNFYPNTGTLTEDDMPKLKRRGLNVFLDLIEPKGRSSFRLVPLDE